MKINEIRVENFKCFNKTNLKFGKITLLTGANSSGKSSIIYAILGALQSGEFPFQFSPNGKYVEMGDFQDLSYKHIKKNIIKIGFTLTGTNDKNNIVINSFWDIDNIRRLPKLKSLKVDALYYTFEIKRDRKYKLKFEYFPEKDPNKKFKSTKLTTKILQLISETMRDFDKQGNNKSLKKDIEKEMELKPLIEFTFNDLSNIKHEISMQGGFALKMIFHELMSAFNKIEKKLNYISSFRLHPDRTYYEQTKTELKVGKFGERYTDQLIQWETKKSKEYIKLIKVLNNLELAENISAKRLDGGRYELLVKPKKKSVSSSLADVGFGISQVLPILIADIQLPNNSTLFVSQPEIHLHPSIQANFADYLIEQIKTTNKTYVIETHSEYLINRLRLAIVKGEIKDDELKSYFFTNNGENIVNHQLEFTKTGVINGAPDDFFKTYMMDVMDIALNSFE